MNTSNQDIRDHYQAAIVDRFALLARLTAAVDRLPPPVDSRSLAPLDQFHVGGLAATVAFAERIGIARGDSVLDAGSGLGGPARYLAETFGVQVEGIDLAPDYVAIANTLTQRAGLGGQVHCSEGDLTALPFEDARFDLIWTQHVSMNISDRALLYKEFRRVLKQGGRFAFYDPLAADGQPEVIYPVPWAASPATSTLLTADATRTCIEQAGFAVTSMEDVTQQAMAWAQQLAASAPPDAGADTLNAAMIVGPRMAPLVANFVRNVRENRVRLVIGIAEAI